MDNKESEKDNPSLEDENYSPQSDYKFLTKKLKSIKESINLLEKNFLDKYNQMF